VSNVFYRLVIGAVTIGLGLGLSGSSAWAQSEVPKDARCTIRVIHAIDEQPHSPEAHTDSHPALQIDPKIDKLRPFLVKPPFTAWREFVLLEKKYLQLVAKAPQHFVLPNGKAASLTFVEHLPDQSGRPHRVRLQLQIDKSGEPGHPAMNTVFVVDEGGIVLQAGQRYEGGMLILGTSCEQIH
jgi:hypothetical protein